MYENPQMPMIPPPAPQPGMQAPPMGMPPQGGQQMDPRMIELIVQQQKMAMQQPAMQRQFKLADQLRADQRGGLQGIQAGRRYVGPGAANLIGNIGQSFMAQHLQGQGDKASKDFADTSGAALDDVLKYWRNKQPGGAFPGATPPINGMPSYE